LKSKILPSIIARRVVRGVAAVLLGLAALALLLSPAPGSGVYSVQIPVVSASLPLASPSETYMVDLGVNQAYVRGVYYGVTASNLTSVNIELYFPARGLKVFYIYVLVYDAERNVLDQGLQVGFTGTSTYTTSVALGGTPLTSVDSVRCRCSAC